MPTLRHTLHHAFWFTLFSPLIGLIYFFILEGVSLQPSAIAMVYCFGIISSLITGIGASFIPERIYRYVGWRVAFSTILGACSTMLLFIAAFGITEVIRLFIQKPLGGVLICIMPGALAGALVSLVITRLPGDSKHRTVSN